MILVTEDIWSLEIRLFRLLLVLHKSKHKFLNIADLSLLRFQSLLFKPDCFNLSVPDLSEKLPRLL